MRYRREACVEEEINQFTIIRKIKKNIIKLLPDRVVW
jgi:hypothetical protein